MGLLQKCERGFKLEATCKSNPFVEKTTMQNGKYIDLEAEPPCVHPAQAPSPSSRAELHG